MQIAQGDNNDDERTDAPAGPGDPGLPASPRGPCCPSAPRFPVGPASPWWDTIKLSLTDKIINTCLLLTHAYYIYE